MYKRQVDSCEGRVELVTGEGDRLNLKMCIRDSYNAVMNGDLTDGTIILMHDIHEPSVNAALRLIPDLIAQGYKLVTVSEMAEAKNVTLQLSLIHIYRILWGRTAEFCQ